MKFSGNNAIAGLPSLGATDASQYNIIHCTIIAFMSRITLENINGRECYKIYITKNYQKYIDKESYLELKEINGSISMQDIEYKINAVTDVDLQLPNLDGYKIIESK